jgi:predicted DNA-binding protein with PD1-like motif
MKYWENTERGIVFLSLHHKDDVLESIHRLIKEANLQDAVVMTGLGSLTKGHFHVIASNNYPPGDTYIKLEGPLEIAQIGGIIGGGQPHLHLTLLDKDHKTWGGHLEPGCEVLTLCEMSIQRVDGTRMTHRDLDGSGVKVLDLA